MLRRGLLRSIKKEDYETAEEDKRRGRKKMKQKNTNKKRSVT